MGGGMADIRQQGWPVDGWTAPQRPQPAVLQGVCGQLEPLNADAHASDLHRAFAAHPALWDYMHYGPFATEDDYLTWAKTSANGTDPFYFALRDRATGRCGGVASYLNIVPANGSIEVGNICFAPELQRGRIATEAMFLMLDWAFAAGYRRYEWKCNALNMPSRRAAGRFGFSFEGIFRQHMVVKGHNRDTAWFAIVDSDWPALRAAYQVWLSDDNFDLKGGQMQRLSDLTKGLCSTVDPAVPNM